jgi:GTP-binding protein
MEFTAVDTAGWEDDSSTDSLEKRMTEQSEMAIARADVCLFVVDGLTGVSELDKSLAQRLRVLKAPVILVINKCEGRRAEENIDGEFYRLGFRTIVRLSAEHGEGLNVLYDALEPHQQEYLRKTESLNSLSDPETDGQSGDNPIQLAILGQPNVGKSTLINRLLGQERLLVGPEVGITRDSIVIDWYYGDQKIKIVDTAGIRKKYRIGPELEKFSVAKSLRALNYAQVVILVLDATEPFERQDLSIASTILEEGRGIIFALNKWDQIADKNKRLGQIKKALVDGPSFLSGYPIIPISATEGMNLDKLMKMVLRVFKSWNSHLPTGKLNRWLRVVEAENTPPLFRGRPTRLKYISQVKTRPPTFALFTNSPERLQETFYYRFLLNRLRTDLDLGLTPVRLLLRKSLNPYGPGSRRG